MPLDPLTSTMSPASTRLRARGSQFRRRLDPVARAGRAAGRACSARIRGPTQWIDRDRRQAGMPRDRRVQRGLGRAQVPACRPGSRCGGPRRRGPRRRSAACGVSRSRLAAIEAGLALKASSIRSKIRSLRPGRARSARACRARRAAPSGQGRWRRSSGRAPAPRPPPAPPARSARSGGPASGTLNRSGAPARRGRHHRGVVASAATSSQPPVGASAAPKRHDARAQPPRPWPRRIGGRGDIGVAGWPCRPARSPSKIDGLFMRDPLDAVERLQMRRRRPW